MGGDGRWKTLVVSTNESNELKKNNAKYPHLQNEREKRKKATQRKQVEESRGSQRLVALEVVVKGGREEGKQHRRTRSSPTESPRNWVFQGCEDWAYSSRGEHPGEGRSHLPGSNKN